MKKLLLAFSMFILLNVFTALPAHSLYPSGSGIEDLAMPRNLENLSENRESLKKEFLFLERDEDGKPLTSEFVKYDLSNYDLKGIDLRGALFSVSTLQGSDLTGADLTDAIAYATHFEFANLKDAIFENAVLTKSFFAKADINGADFTNAILDRDQREYLCKIAEGSNSVTGVKTYESLDCIAGLATANAS